MEMSMKLISQTISVLLILLSAAHAAEPQDPDALYQKAAYLMNLGYGVVSKSTRKRGGMWLFITIEQQPIVATSRTH
jgi:hypothetical protein